MLFTCTVAKTLYSNHLIDFSGEKWIPYYFLRKQKLRDFLTLLFKELLSSTKVFFWKRNTSTHSIDISTISTGSISGSRVSVWVAIAQLITAETVPSGRSINGISYVTKLLCVSDHLRCYLDAFSNYLLSLR